MYLVILCLGCRNSSSRTRRPNTSEEFVTHQDYNIKSSTSNCTLDSELSFHESTIIMAPLATTRHDINFVPKATQFSSQSNVSPLTLTRTSEARFYSIMPSDEPPTCSGGSSTFLNDALDDLPCRSSVRNVAIEVGVPCTIIVSISNLLSTKCFNASNTSSIFDAKVN